MQPLPHHNISLSCTALLGCFFIDRCESQAFCKLSTSAVAAIPLCTGVVQALHAVLNKVTIQPIELLMRTDIYRQSFTIMLRNPANAAVTYAISHAPAVTIAVDKAWYRVPYDVNAPTADVTLSSTSVTVPAAGSAQVQVCCGASGRTSLQTVVCCGFHASKGCMSHLGHVADV